MMKKYDTNDTFNEVNDTNLHLHIQHSFET